MVEESREKDQTEKRMRSGEASRCEINPVKVVLMFLSILIAAVHVCFCVSVCVCVRVCVCVCKRQSSCAIGSLSYRGE